MEIAYKYPRAFGVQAELFRQFNGQLIRIYSSSSLGIPSLTFTCIRSFHCRKPFASPYLASGEGERLGVTPQLALSMGTPLPHHQTIAATRRTNPREPPPPCGTKTVAGTSAEGFSMAQPSTQPSEVIVEPDEALIAGAEANSRPQPDPPRDDGTGDVPLDDDDDAEERGLSALDQMHEEIQ